MWPFSKKTPAPTSDPGNVHGPVLVAMEPWVRRHRRMAWKPVVTPGRGDVLSGFGGVPALGKGEPRPRCPVCARELSLFLQLDGRTTPAESPWTGPQVMQLFYCRACEADHEGWAAFSKVHVARSVPAEKLTELGPASATDLRASTITGWEPIDDLPAAEEHEDLGIIYKYDFKAGRVAVSCPVIGVQLADLDAHAADEQGRELAEAIASAAPGDKLGGWPHWIQGVEYPACPRCGTVMSLVFQLDSEDNVDHMFGDSGCGHITQCPNHPDVLAFAWACC